jgi:NAD(P)-dependent dehydrogenase (short-subunit alcohol dehydrogenase family)
MPDLKGKITIVTGSTSGIGRGIADYFAELGAQVVVTGRDLKRGSDAVQKIRDAGGTAEFIDVDLVEERSCRELIGFAVEKFGGLDILVNNAADITRGNIENTEIDNLDRILAINLRAPFILIPAALPLFQKRAGGAVVNIGSVNAYIGEPKLCAYSISKGGMMTLTKNAASYLNKYRIRINQINVGWTLTEGEKHIKLEEGKGPHWIDAAVASRPFGRLLYPRDIAHAAAYYASDDAACVTGSVMDLEQYPVGAPPDW